MTVKNVITFEPRKAPAIQLQFVELRLADDCSIEMRLIDDGGGVFVLEYDLASSPKGFDLDRLREAWARWRGSSEVVA